MHLLNAKSVNDNAEEVLRVLASRAGDATMFRLGEQEVDPQVHTAHDGAVCIRGHVDQSITEPTTMVAANPHAAYFADLSRADAAPSSDPQSSRSRQAFRVEALQRQQRRQSLRAPIPEHWSLFAYGPMERRYTFRGQDASLSGLGGHVCKRGHQASMRPDVERLELRVSGGAVCHLSIQVCRHYSGTPCTDCGSDDYVGLRIAPVQPRDQRIYTKQVCRLLFPHIAIGVDECDAIWSVLDQAGYFDLSGKDADFFTRKKDDYKAFNQRMSLAPQLGHQLAWRQDGEVEASIASCRAFSRAHLLHHLGKLSKRGRDKTSLRDILVCSVELTKHDSNVDWVCAYLNKAVPFHRQSAIPFAEFFADSDNAACLPMHLFEVDANHAAQKSEMQNEVYRVRVSNDRERRQLSEVLNARFGRCLTEALDRTPERLDWSASGEEWSDVGLKRQRQVIVATDAAGQAVAAAVLEMASAGSNLFHIFNAMTVTQLDASLTEAQLSDAHADLTRAAARWFLQHGVQVFITPVYDAETNLSAPQGAVSLGSGALWVVERSLFCCLQEYWHLQL